MSAPKRTPRVLPDRPSQEHLHKQAKRLARAAALGLAAAQRRLAVDYGAATWAELMRAVEAAQPLSPLGAAAKAGNAAAVRRLLGEGASPDGAPADRGGVRGGRRAAGIAEVRRAGRGPARTRPRRDQPPDRGGATGARCRRRPQRVPAGAHAQPAAAHGAVLLEDLPTMELLVARGARTDVPDKLWGSTPLGWAVHENKPRAREWLEKNSPPHSDGEEC